MKSLKRNLEISGWFKIGPSGTITVTGTAGGAISATGRGKTITSQETFSGDSGARMAARRFADAMVEAFSDGGKGFATTRLAFVNRKGADNAELYMCYPDGYDIRQLTSDGRAAVGPRWAPNGKEIYYTGFLHEKQLVYRLNVETEARDCLGMFKNGASGAAVSPDGRSAAIILSYQGNPELYVMDLATRKIQRMTNTPAAAESSPGWSPDGRKIAYVSDQTRNPQIYICDVASRQSTRYTSKGRQNTHPDWAKSGRLCWSSLQAGQWCIMASEPNGGEASARMVTQPGTWQDPSWAADGRHLVASRDKAIFLVDTEPDGDKPVQLFYNKGNWMNPAFSK
jgi:TolB protein